MPGGTPGYTHANPYLGMLDEIDRCEECQGSTVLSREALTRPGVAVRVEGREHIEIARTSIAQGQEGSAILVETY